MESKIFIDINYASRTPQIVVHRGGESDDPRDKLIDMLLGEAMPGVSAGYCLIERYAERDGKTVSVITPVHPTEMISHIPLIAQYAHENKAVDTAKVPKRYEEIITAEYDKIHTPKVANR